VPKAVSKMRFTDLAVSRIKPPATGRTIIWDSLLPTFGLRISHTGRKVWIISIRRPGKRNPVRLNVGTFPKIKTAEARDKARELLEGPPPAAPATFRELAEQFLEHGRTKRGRLLRPATKGEYRRSLMVHAAQLHREQIREITRRQVADVIATVARARGTTSAMRTRAALSRFFGWAVATGRADVNIVAGTEGYDVPKRSRVLSDGEIRAIWAATEERSDFNMILRLCLWCGVRRGEAGGMRWSEMAATDAGIIWHVPGSRVKNGRDLILPLPRQALEALDRWPRVLGKNAVFGRGPNGFQAWSQSKRRLDARLGFDRDWDLHDLRRTVETRLIGLGVQKDYVNRILNHAQGPIDEAYNQYEYLGEKELALKRWAAELDRITTSDRAKVIALRREV
jgi:integrase